jgi:hypothetical protein
MSSMYARNIVKIFAPHRSRFTTLLSLIPSKSLKHPQLFETRLATVLTVNMQQNFICHNNEAICPLYMLEISLKFLRPITAASPLYFRSFPQNP